MKKGPRTLKNPLLTPEVKVEIYNCVFVFWLLHEIKWFKKKVLRLFSYPNTFSNICFPFISPFLQEAITHKTTDTPTLQSTVLSYSGNLLEKNKKSQYSI